MTYNLSFLPEVEEDVIAGYVWTFSKPEVEYVVQRKKKSHPKKSMRRTR